MWVKSRGNVGGFENVVYILRNLYMILRNLSTQLWLYDIMQPDKQEEVAEMYEILNASKEPINYTARGLVYLEICGNEIYPVASRIGLAGGNQENSLKSAAMRVRSGDSGLVAISGDEYGNITVFRIDDIDALLEGYGLAQDNGHRHQLRWEYASIDNGKSPYAEVELKFLCGCHLNTGNIRTREKELRKQFGLELRLSGLRPTNDPTCAKVGIKRNGLKDKEKELK